MSTENISSRCAPRWGSGQSCLEITRSNMIVGSGSLGGLTPEWGTVLKSHMLVDKSAACICSSEGWPLGPLGSVRKNRLRKMIVHIYLAAVMLHQEYHSQSGALHYRRTGKREPGLQRHQEGQWAGAYGSIWGEAEGAGLWLGEGKAKGTLLLV